MSIVIQKVICHAGVACRVAGVLMICLLSQAASIQAQEGCAKVRDLMKKGEWTQAEQHLLDSGDTDEKLCAFHLAKAYFEKGDHKRGIQWINYAKKFLHRGSPPQLHIGILYHKLKYDEELAACAQDWRHLQNYDPNGAAQLEDEMGRELRATLRLYWRDPWPDGVCQDVNLPCHQELRQEAERLNRICVLVREFNALEKLHKSLEGVRRGIEALRALNKAKIPLGTRLARYEALDTYFKAMARADKATDGGEEQLAALQQAWKALEKARNEGERGKSIATFQLDLDRRIRTAKQAGYRVLDNTLFRYLRFQDPIFITSILPNLLQLWRDQEFSNSLAKINKAGFNLSDTIVAMSIAYELNGDYLNNNGYYTGAIKKYIESVKHLDKLKSKLRWEIYKTCLKHISGKVKLVAAKEAKPFDQVLGDVDVPVPLFEAMGIQKDEEIQNERPALNDNQFVNKASEFSDKDLKELKALCEQGRCADSVRLLNDLARQGKWKDEDVRFAKSRLYEWWGDARRAEGERNFFKEGILLLYALENYGISGDFQPAYQEQLRHKILDIVQKKTLHSNWLAAMKREGGRIASWMQKDLEIKTWLRLAGDLRTYKSQCKYYSSIIAYGKCEDGLKELNRNQKSKRSRLSRDMFNWARAQIYEWWGDYRRQEGDVANAIENYIMSGNLESLKQSELRRKIQNILDHEGKSWRDIEKNLRKPEWLEEGHQASPDNRPARSVTFYTYDEAMADADKAASGSWEKLAALQRARKALDKARKKGERGKSITDSELALDRRILKAEIAHYLVSKDQAPSQDIVMNWRDRQRRFFDAYKLKADGYEKIVAVLLLVKPCRDKNQDKLLTEAMVCRELFSASQWEEEFPYKDRVEKFSNIEVDRFNTKAKRALSAARAYFEMGEVSDLIPSSGVFEQTLALLDNYYRNEVDQVDLDNLLKQDIVLQAAKVKKRSGERLTAEDIKLLPAQVLVREGLQVVETPTEKEVDKPDIGLPDLLRIPSKTELSPLSEFQTDDVLKELKSLCEQGKCRDALRLLDDLKRQDKLGGQDLQIAKSRLYEWWGDARRAEGEKNFPKEGILLLDALEDYGISGNFQPAHQEQLKQKILDIVQKKAIHRNWLAAMKREKRNIASWVQKDPEIKTWLQLAGDLRFYKSQCKYVRLIAAYGKCEDGLKELNRNQKYASTRLPRDMFVWARAQIFEWWGDYRRQEGRVANAVENYVISGNLAPLKQPEMSRKIQAILDREGKTWREVSGKVRIPPWLRE